MFNHFAHEIRAPLSPIRVQTWLLMQASLTAAARRHAFDLIERNVDRLNRLDNDLVDIGRAQVGRLRIEPTSVTVDALAASLVHDLMPAARVKHIALELEDGFAPAIVETDAGRLEQVLVNLVSNAIKYSPDGSRVRVVVAGGAQHV